jgi:hypothetical protein
MPYVTAKKLLLLPLLAMPFANAEIVEIPAEEMTESYIKDTTVIIRKQAPSEISKTRSVIRVSPIEDDFSEGEAASDGTEVQRAAYEQMPFDMTAQTQYQFESASSYAIESPAYDCDRHANDDRLRQILGLEAGEPIDYSNLQFPTTPIAPDGTILPNNANITGSQFQIVIPNSNNYGSDAYSSANGELGVTITPEQITFQVNAPR